MNREPEAELRRIVRMLEKTEQLAQNASLTGSLAGGKDFAIRSYNSVLHHLSETSEIPSAIFPPLADSASIDDVGFASAQLAEYLREGLPESQQTAGQSGQPGRILGDGNVLFKIGSLGEIAELVRENLPEWLRGKRAEPESTQGSAERTESTQQSAPPPPPGAQATSGTPPPARMPLPPRQARIEELRTERQPEASHPPAARVPGAD
jgi:hypothetical protein